jgi:hypothetical protein
MKEELKTWLKKPEAWLRIIEIIVIIAAFVLGYFNYLSNQDNNSKILKLETTNSQLFNNQTVLQATVTALTKNQTDLQQKIFAIENYNPTIRAESVSPILIGPPSSSQITVFPDGAVSFQFSGTLQLNLTVLVSTAHSGELIITSLYFYGYNTSQIQVGFSISGVSAKDYIHPFTAGSAEILSVSIPFTTFYKFTESHILEYKNYDIGYVGFSIIFHDFQTDSIRYSATNRAAFQWNNSTSTS